MDPARALAGGLVTPSAIDTGSSPTCKPAARRCKDMGNLLEMGDGLIGGRIGAAPSFLGNSPTTRGDTLLLSGLDSATPAPEPPDSDCDARNAGETLAVAGGGAGAAAVHHPHHSATSGVVTDILMRGASSHAQPSTPNQPGTTVQLQQNTPPSLPSVEALVSGGGGPARSSSGGGTGHKRGRAATSGNVPTTGSPEAGTGTLTAVDAAQPHPPLKRASSRYVGGHLLSSNRNTTTERDS
jgi:hypothetical protein